MGKWEGGREKVGRKKRKRKEEQKEEKAGPWGLLYCQFSHLVCSRAVRNSVSKNVKWWTVCLRKDSIVALWPPPTHACMSTHAYRQGKRK